MNKFCNEVYVLFYKWIQLELKLDINELRTMFSLLLKGDRKFIRYCPESIEQDIFAFEKIILNYPENHRTAILNFIYCCIDVYAFDSIKQHKKILQIDMLYYRSTIAQYYILNFLDDKLTIDNFTSFKKELYQIGVIINQYYSSKDDMQKPIIADMIRTKTSELFKRYNFSYSLPLCTTS